MTKVLLIGPDSDFTRQLYRAFLDGGHDAAYINERSGATWSLIWWVVRHVPAFRRLRNHLLAWRIIRTARTQKPELVLILKGMTIKLPTLRILKGMGAKLANWFPENGNHEPYASWLSKHIGAYDLFFAFDSGLLGRQAEFPQTRIIYLPLAVGPDSFRVDALTAEDRQKYASDICFVGAWYPEREKVLNELRDHDLKIFGWKGWERSSLAKYYGGPLNAQESAKAYRSAKIVLNMNLEPAVNGVNAKTFEICAAGGFQITDWRADLPKLFEEDRELVVFRSIPELKEKIGQYLGDDATRARIAKGGYDRVLREHTMRHRVKVMISSL